MVTVVKIQNGHHLGFCLKLNFCRPFCLILRNLDLKERLYEVKKGFDNLKTIYNLRIHDTKRVTPWLGEESLYDFQVESVEYIASNAAALFPSPQGPYSAIQNIAGSWT